MPWNGPAALFLPRCSACAEASLRLRSELPRQALRRWVRAELSRLLGLPLGEFWIGVTHETSLRSAVLLRLGTRKLGLLLGAQGRARARNTRFGAAVRGQLRSYKAESQPDRAARPFHNPTSPRISGNTALSGIRKSAVRGASAFAQTSAFSKVSRKQIDDEEKSLIANRCLLVDLSDRTRTKEGSWPRDAES